jgi:hypothetical protein
LTMGRVEMEQNQKGKSGSSTHVVRCVCVAELIVAVVPERQWIVTRRHAIESTYVAPTSPTISYLGIRRAISRCWGLHAIEKVLR